MSFKHRSVNKLTAQVQLTVNTVNYRLSVALRQVIYNFHFEWILFRVPSPSVRASTIIGPVFMQFMQNICRPTSVLQHTAV